MTVVKPGPGTPVTTFKATNWSQNEMITQSKANVSNNNIDWLFRNTPRAKYSLPGNGRDLQRNEGIKIAGGRIIIAEPTKSDAEGEVRFGNFFSNGCEPIVTTGVISTFPGIACAISGIGGGIPDQRGIKVKVKISDWLKTTRPTFGETFYIAFNAMGF